MRKWNLLLGFALTLLLAVVILPGQAEAATVASGSCGDNLTWTVDDTDKLTISGTGAMDDYTSTNRPTWETEIFDSVEVEEGVTTIGDYAFTGQSLDNVTLPVSLTSIGDNAFNGATITEAHFAGNLKQWNDNVTEGTGNTALTGIIEMDQDVTYSGEGITLAKGKATVTTTVVDSDFKTEYNDYVFEVEFVGVTELGENACSSLSSLNCVTIPATVTEIKDGAFKDCTSLTSATIPEGVTIINRQVFYGCTNLESVAIPESVTTIWNSAFSYCTSLESVALPDSLQTLGNYVFYGCSNLTTVTMGNDVCSMGQYMFGDCTSLKSISISASLTHIGNRVFYNCHSIEKVYISDLKNWCNITFNSNEWYFSNPFCYSHASLYLNNQLVTDLSIPDDVISINNYVFYGCSSIESVTIPDSVTSIGTSAFAECSNLNSVTIPDSVTSIGGSAFSQCSSLNSITIPDSVTSIEESTFSYCTNLGIVIIGDSVTDIENSAFKQCTNLTSVTIPGSVTTIENGAFYSTVPAPIADVYYDGTATMWGDVTIGDSNSNLTSATFHYADACGTTGDCTWVLRDGQLKITGSGSMADYTANTAPWYTFKDDITDVLVKPNVTNVGNYAFSGLTDLETVTGLDGVTSIGEGAFSGCSDLDGLSLPAGVTTMGANAFAGCTELTSAGPADSGAAIEFNWALNIPANAFSGADCLATLTFPDNANQVLASTAANCTALTTVNLPSSMRRIQANAFTGCTSLTEITLPSSIERSYGGAFSGCTNLTRVNISDLTKWLAVTHANAAANPLSNGADLYLSGVKLVDLTVPASTEVKAYAFYGCTSLKTVNLPGTVPSIGTDAFASCTNLTDVYYDGMESGWDAANHAGSTGYSGATIHILPEFVARNIVLSGQIGMNFYLRIPDGLEADSCMVFTIANGGTVTVNTSAATYETDKGRYKFTCPVNSIEMADEITATFHYVDGETAKTVQYTGSVLSYLNTIIENTENLPSYTAAQPLAKAINDYGYYAQQALPNGSRHTQMPSAYTPEESLITELTRYPVTATLTGTDITAASYSLSLDSETMINFYLTSTSALTKENVHVSAPSGVTFQYTVAQQADGRYRVQITGIGAHELGAVFTVTTDGRAEINASALSYVQRCLANSNQTDATKHAAAALYNYYNEAINYSPAS